jgi:hypothetical protein
MVEGWVALFFDCLGIPGLGVSTASAPLLASGFALTVDPLCFGKGGKPFCADVRPPLRRGALAPALWWGDAPTGHPWPNGARSASMPSAPHHNTSTQPPDA